MTNIIKITKREILRQSSPIYYRLGILGSNALREDLLIQTLRENKYDLNEKWSAVRLDISYTLLPTHRFHLINSQERTTETTFRRIS